MTVRIDEVDELLLNRLLDGELSEGEAAALRRRIDAEPDLRIAFEQLTRIHELLAARAADQPAVDWERFHRGVIAAATPRMSVRRLVLTFPRWARVAAPLAAAACLALWLILPRAFSPAERVDRPGTGLTVAHQQPTPPPAEKPAGTLVVNFHRPPAPASGEPRVTLPESALRVAYERSLELDEYIRKIDEARSRQPGWRLYMVHTEPPGAGPREVHDLDVPPM